MECVAISFELSKILKEKGFDEYTETMFTEYGDVCNRESILGIRVGIYPRLSQSLLQKWLREVHKIIVIADYDREMNNYIYTVDSESACKFDFSHYNTYEEALEEGLKQGLNLITNN